ncbi:glycosyl hydrolase 2 galactose-binding domain-containing protein [Mycolicibacterium sp.]|uniref:glycoside hydrolase family 2 protein n=1 Tax=Mycolicibacterium sp. TaxID=2320850 RepID=UPI0037C5D385
MLLALCVADLPSFARPEPPSGRIELSQGWQLASARTVQADGVALSSPGTPEGGWHTVTHMPATVLQALQDDGTYPDLYFDENLTDVPDDLYRQDWWYRTTFAAPAGSTSYRLELPGVNYRAEVWLNGRMVAGNAEVVGMHTNHELDVSRFVNAGGENTLAVRVTPEQALQDIDGVELADSWWDWINWNRIGYQGPEKNPLRGNSFVADRNAGIFQPVYLSFSGPVVVRDSVVTTELPLPATDRAKLTIHSNVHNTSDTAVRGVVRARISRAGKPTIEVDQPVRLAPGEQREIQFDPTTFGALNVENPDLWWPYTMGDPNLYDLQLEFRQYGQATDTHSTRFGIRTVQQHRDDDEQYPDLGRGGSFYLTVNGRDFLVRGAAYTPDLLFRYDPQREDAILGYVRDLGLNMLRLEGKFPGENIIERADELGIPLMYGWMCCNQWEKWWQWDDEDRRVADASLRSQILALRGHPAAFLWANGSDGKPPEGVLDGYHAILADLRWPNAVVDTVSSLARTDDGEPDWDGIHMAGPYTWRPPSYWFSGRYQATRGSNAEQGDNEHIPPFASLKKFLPPDKLWPINEAWYFHAGANPSNAVLESIRTAVMQRYGSSRNAEEFAGKAQLAHYESTRAQFEAFAALGWANHKMTIYWMLNNHWPSFFGHLFDYYLRPGGAYYGAKKGLRPLSAVFDSYATGDHSQANVTVVNQSPDDQRDVRVRVRTYDLAGRVRDDRTSDPVSVPSGGALRALTLPRVAPDSRVFFVRCELLDAAGAVIGENTYWQSQQRDDVGNPANDQAFDLVQSSWADMTPLNTMAKTPLRVTAERSAGPAGTTVVIRLHNPTRQIGFFERAEVMATPDGDEILPIEYSDNYVTVYPGETVELTGKVTETEPMPNWVRVGGYNTAPVVAPIDQRVRR